MTTIIARRRTVVVAAVAALSLAASCPPQRRSPESVAAAGLRVLEGTKLVSAAIMEAERAGVLSEDAAAVALAHVRRALTYAEDLPKALRAYHDAQPADRPCRLMRARAVLSTVVQVLHATAVDDRVPALAELVVQVNELALRLQQIGQGGEPCLSS